MSVLGVGGGGSFVHDGLNYSEEGGLIILDGVILDPTVFELTGKVPLNDGAVKVQAS